jgi:hypothetical protein
LLALKKSLSTTLPKRRGFVPRLLRLDEKLVIITAEHTNKLRITPLPPDQPLRSSASVTFASIMAKNHTRALFPFIVPSLKAPDGLLAYSGRMDSTETFSRPVGGKATF